MSLSCIVSEILPLVCELPAYVTIHDLESTFHLNAAAAMKAIAQTIVVISFQGNMCCIFRDIGHGVVFGN